MIGRRALALLALAVAAPPAAGSTVSAEGGTLHFTAAPGERNHLRVDIRRGAEIEVSDAAALQAGPGCEATGSTSARCHAVGLGRVEADLGDGDDVATLGVDGEFGAHVDHEELHGVPQVVAAVRAGEGNDRVALPGLGDGDAIDAGAGDDVLTAGPFADVIAGGDGNDSISAGGGADRVDAGAGNDAVRGGAGDDVIGGGAGEDTVSAGGGNDLVRLRDGERDSATCGGGRDRTEVDRVDMTPSLREDVLCDGSEIVRPSIEFVLVRGDYGGGFRGKLDRKGRLPIHLRFNKPACRGSIRLTGVFADGDGYRFEGGARTRFRANRNAKEARVRVKLSAAQRRILSRHPAMGWQFDIELRDELGRRVRQHAIDDA